MPELVRSRLAKLDAAVLAGYCLLAFLYLGLAPLIEDGHQYVGGRDDPQIFIWSFAWWPHAILHGQNPFFSHAIWSPAGANLEWSTTVPGLALLFTPLTELVGPAASYDVAQVLMPALAAWTAFRLCRYLTGALWPSLLGGYMFGFSSYVLAQAGGAGHLHLSSVFPLPLVALVVLRFLDARLDARGLVLRLGPLLAFQFLCSTEVALLLGIALVLALIVGFAVAPARRDRLVSLLPPLLWAGVFAALLSAPFLYYALTGIPDGPFLPPNSLTADLVNFVVPTKTTALGGNLLAGVSKRFPGLPNGEQGAYLGLPALLCVALFARARRRTPSGRFLLISLALAVVVALGGRAVVAGDATIRLPWSLVGSAPLLENVLTGRFVVFAALVVAVVMALWLAEQRAGPMRVALPLLAVLAIVPNSFGGRFATTYRVPAFFAESRYRDCLGRGETVAAFPLRGPRSLLWQVDAGFRFKLAGGELGPDIPASFFTPVEVLPIIGGQPLGADKAPALRAFLADKHVTSVAVDAAHASDYTAALDAIARPQVVGGVYLYHLTPYPPPCRGS